MEQLKVKDITILVQKLKASGMTLEEIDDLPIYLGKDDELNGIHTGWCINLLDTNDKSEDTQYFVEMINEDYANEKLNGKGILIS
jgi:hypothetical protein